MADDRHPCGRRVRGAGERVRPNAGHLGLRLRPAARSRVASCAGHASACGRAGWRSGRAPQPWRTGHRPRPASRRSAHPVCRFRTRRFVAIDRCAATRGSDSATRATSFRWAPSRCRGHVEHDVLRHRIDARTPMWAGVDCTARRARRPTGAVTIDSLAAADLPTLPAESRESRCRAALYAPARRSVRAVAVLGSEPDWVVASGVPARPPAVPRLRT